MREKQISIFNDLEKVNYNSENWNSLKLFNINQYFQNSYQLISMRGKI